MIVNSEAFAIDEKRKSITADGVFHDTYTGEGPCPPTG